MKKFIFMMLALFASGLFANEWYPQRELLTDIQPHQASKDTAWYEYGGPAYVWTIPYERATFFDATTFPGLGSYPITLHAVTSYLYNAGNTVSYKIYDADGETLLWQSSDFSSSVGWNTYGLSPDSVIIHNDFYVAVVPEGSGLPRQISDAGGAASDHSYYGFAGNWVPFYDETDRYDWNTAIYASPYNGADIFEPKIASISGTESFMGVNANITLELTDQNTSVVSPFNGEYSFDGGNTWNTFVMNAAKGKFPFTGVIPGQPDGTNGVVRFAVDDGLGNSGYTREVPISWSIDNLMINESFEGILFPPAGWSLQTTGAGWIQLGVQPYPTIQSGDYSAAHLDDQGTQNDWIISPAIAIPATNSCTLSFWQSSYWVDYITTHEVAVSTDGGSTWTAIYTDPDGSTDVQNAVLTQEIFALTAYAGQTINIGWHYLGDYSDQWFIDDIQLQYDYEGPTIVDIVGNPVLAPTIGAYLNNPLVMNVTVNDLTGVQSVVGHYSIDGAPVVDLPFAAAKAGNEVWTATLPAQSSVKSGVINFDMIDLGGIASPTTSDYTFEYISDGEAPHFDYVKGTQAFLNQPMNLTVSFDDESAILSCMGHYTKDDWATQYDFALTASKVHDYIYTGSIPAESAEVLDGKVKFTVTDVETNQVVTSDYLVQWVDAQNIIVENFESGAGNWTLTGNWAIVTEGEYTSASSALTESPGGNYADDEDTAAQWKTAFDLATNPAASISFWTKFDLENGYDYTYFEGSSDGGTTWILLKELNGEGIGWHEEKISMNAFAGKSNVTFRFHFVSDGGYNTEGMYIDDLVMTTFNIDHGNPAIVSDPYKPLFYEGVLGNYTDAVEILDFSGIASATVYYTVDGGTELSVSAVNTTDDWYEFTIPQQGPGSQVDYYIVAVDGSAQANEETSPTYSYIAGEHLIYDSGIVSYYHELETDDAWAVRCTVPGTDSLNTYKGGLDYILLRNYFDTSHSSATMLVHVWADNNGEPGAELVTPFDVVSEANALNPSKMTRVDLRAYNIEVTGDFWIGVSAPYGSIFMTMEAADEEGTTQFERSTFGNWDTDHWAWNAPSATDNWHFRAVVDGVYSALPNSATTVTASVAGDQVTIDWEDCSNADSYDLYKCATPYGTYEIVASDIVPSQYTYTETATKMFYYVVSKNAAKEASPKTISVKKSSAR